MKRSTPILLLIACILGAPHGALAGESNPSYGDLPTGVGQLDAINIFPNMQPDAFGNMYKTAVQAAANELREILEKSKTERTDDSDVDGFVIILDRVKFGWRQDKDLWGEHGGQIKAFEWAVVVFHFSARRYHNRRWRQTGQYYIRVRIRPDGSVQSAYH